MRDIEFRGKRVDNGEWVYGGIIPLDIDSGYVFISEPFISASTLPLDFIIKNHTYLVDPKTVGQYTGLRDKNGTKIYEGDEISTDLWRPFNIVEYKNGCFMLNCYDGDEAYYDLMFPIGACLNSESEFYEYGEVIGNIYDNYR